MSSRLSTPETTWCLLLKPMLSMTPLTAEPLNESWKEKLVITEDQGLETSPQSPFPISTTCDRHLFTDGLTSTLKKPNQSGQPLGKEENLGRTGVLDTCG